MVKKNSPPRTARPCRAVAFCAERACCDVDGERLARSCTHRNVSQKEAFFIAGVIDQHRVREPCSSGRRHGGASFCFCWSGGCDCTFACAWWALKRQHDRPRVRLDALPHRVTD